MKTSKILSKVGSFALAGMMTAAAAIPAFAAQEDIIDMNRTGSFTIHKYDLTAAENAGVDVSQFTATGEQDITAEQTLEDYALQGVEYTYLRVGDIMTYSVGGKASVLYGVDDAQLFTSLNLNTADAQTTESSVCYYTSDQLSHALADVLENNTSGKNTLETYISSTSGGVAMNETDAYGTTTADNLKLGLYMVVETKVPENVHCTTDPFLVTVPSTNATGDYWNYDVVVYPKNQTNEPTLDKTVSENGTFADTATVSEGDVLSYRLTSKLPTISSKATYLSQYTYVDTLTSGLAFNRDTQIAFYDSAEKAGKDNAAEAVMVWNKDNHSELFSAAYDGQKMTVSMTEGGLAEMNPAFSDLYMVVSYTVTVQSTADMVNGDAGNQNNATLTYGRTNATYTQTIEDKAIVYTYGINLSKKFSDDKGNGAKVGFTVKNETDSYYVTANGENGVYYVTGQAEQEADATVLHPSADGALILNGLEADTYVMTETATDAGYSLLKDSITIVIKETETTITASTANVTGTENPNGTVLVTQTASAAATVDGTDASMSSDGESQNGRVDMTVTNTRSFTLPKTGGAGTWAVTILGVLGVAGGAAIMVNQKKKVQL